MTQGVNRPRHTFLQLVTGAADPADQCFTVSVRGTDESRRPKHGSIATTNRAPDESAH
ncbi:MAG: hypothetical protein ACOCZC_02280 [Halodesulfurarchaeum sp.]